jgi:hypothetical protein
MDLIRNRQGREVVALAESPEDAKSRVQSKFTGW